MKMFLKLVTLILLISLKIIACQIGRIGTMYWQLYAKNRDYTLYITATL